MARIPISFYLNVIAGIIVIFHHCVASQTGDVALNKVTGASGRFYALFRDTVRAFQHGYTSRLEIALCGPVHHILPHDAVAYLGVHYCRLSAQNSRSDGAASNAQKFRGGYGSANFAYCQPPMQPLVTQTSAEGSAVNLRWSSQDHIYQEIWDRLSGVVAAIGSLLLRSCASWWWFTAPVKMTGFLLGTYSTLSVVGYLSGEGASMAIRCVDQVYMTIIADFLRCIEWEAQRQALEISVLMMERGYGLVTYADKRRGTQGSEHCKNVH